MPDIAWKQPGQVPRGHEQTEVHSDQIAPIRFSMPVYETTKFKRFKVNHMVLRDKVVLQFFSADPVQQVQDVLRRRLGVNQLYPPEITFVPEVKSHAVTFKGEIPEVMLQWINEQVKKIDADLGAR